MSRDALVARIRDDHRRGATELARDALLALEEFARSSSGDVLEETIGLARELARARPTMCAIAGVLDHLVAQLESGQGDAHARVHRAVEQTLEWSREATDRAVASAAALLSEARAIFTHSRSSTAESALMRLAPPARVIATESRPGYEGRTLASRLAENGAEVELVTDAQMGLMVRDADAVLVGADAILADGAFVNKVGTHVLALAAHDAKVPFYVCAESFKLSKDLDFPAEEHDPSELEAPDRPGIRARNFYFERTPPELVTAYLSDIAVEDQIELATKRR